MIVFRPERTADIVQRLVKLGNAIRNVTLLAFIIFFVVFLSFGMIALSLLVSLDPTITLALGSILGAAIGYLVGSFAAALIVSTLEWMAQMLIIQSELVSKSKRGV